MILAQLSFKNQNPEYQRIFDETDDFGADYLNVMEYGVSKIRDDTLRLMVLNDLGYYYHSRNLKKAFEIIEEGLNEARNLGDQLWEGRLQVSEGAILLRMEKLDLAEFTLKSAMGKIPASESWLLLTNLGYVFERRGNLSEAFQYATETLELGEKYKDKKAMAMAYSDMSNLLWKLGKYEKGVEYGKKSIALFEDRGILDLDFDFTFHVLGNNLLELKRYDEALSYFQRSIAIGEKYKFYNMIIRYFASRVELKQ